jgi:hypothetical protein
MTRPYRRNGGPPPRVASVANVDGAVGHPRSVKYRAASGRLKNCCRELLSFSIVGHPSGAFAMAANDRFETHRRSVALTNTAGRLNTRDGAMRRENRHYRRHERWLPLENAPYSVPRYVATLEANVCECGDQAEHPFTEVAAEYVGHHDGKPANRAAVGTKTVAASLDDPLFRITGAQKTFFTPSMSFTLIGRMSD